MFILPSPTMEYALHYAISTVSSISFSPHKKIGLINTCTLYPFALQESLKLSFSFPISPNFEAKFSIDQIVKEERKDQLCTMRSTALLALFNLVLLATVSSTQAYDFFYFVLQWPGSYCDTKQSCCYPTSGKPGADFGIHGLWPNNKDGSYPSNCDSGKPFDESKVQALLSRLQSEWPTLACPSNDGTNFWAHEWEKHGTCAEAIFDEYNYFKTALDLKRQLNLLGSLQSAGIQPDDGLYSLTSIKDAIRQGTGYTPYIECNVDDSGNSQLYQVYLCVDSSGSRLVECPIFPRGRCGSQIEFPSF